MVLGVLAGEARAAETYPQPVSESVEITAPGQMTILSYPKYYKNAQDQLIEVDTTLVASEEPDWDYEVTTGIWSLKVSADGTFQARHAGDVFTYKFHSLGIGRGSGYRQLDLGEPDWSNLNVLGDTVLWSEVYPNIDVSVRYIHDILKVDVKVKKALMNQIRDSVQTGQFKADDYLTARFDVPNVLITSIPKRGKKPVDLYEENLAVNQPIHFEKDGKPVHKLRPVETYVVDDEGQQIHVGQPGESRIRSAQQWTLRRNAPGLAEMSANLGDLADAPEGDVVIDPSVTFEGEGFYGGGDLTDTYICSSYSDTYYETSNYLALGLEGSTEHRILIGVQNISSKLAAAVVVNSASLYLYYS